MLIYGSRLINTPVLSMQVSGPVGYVSGIIIDPDNLKIIALRLSSPTISRGEADILDADSIREYSELGIIIDSADDLAFPDDILKISKVIALNFDLVGLKVETKKGSKLGKIVNYTLDPNSFMIQQIIVKRPAIKSFLDPELTIHRNEIIEVDDYKVVVKDEEKVIKQKAEKENFVPNFVNPFRNSELSPAPARTKTPDDTNTE